MKGRSVKRPARRQRQTLATKDAALARKYAVPLEKLRRSIMFLLSRPEQVGMVLCQMDSISKYREVVEQAELLACDPAAREAYDRETERIHAKNAKAEQAWVERECTTGR